MFQFFIHTGRWLDIVVKKIAQALIVQRAKWYTEGWIPRLALTPRSMSSGSHKSERPVCSNSTWYEYVPLYATYSTLSEVFLIEVGKYSCHCARWSSVNWFQAIICNFPSV